MREHYYIGHKIVGEDGKKDGSGDVVCEGNSAIPVSVMSQRQSIERDRRDLFRNMDSIKEGSNLGNLNSNPLSTDKEYGTIFGIMSESNLDDVDMAAGTIEGFIGKKN